MPPLPFNYITRLLRASSGGGVLPSIDYVVLIGSSTTFFAMQSDQAIGLQIHNLRNKFYTEGIDVPVINKSVGGSTIANADTNINTYISEIGNAGKKVAFIVHIGSNDIGTTSLSGMLQATKDAMNAGLSSIVSKITAAGHVAILTTVNSRSGQDVIYAEWASAFYEPKIQTDTPRGYAGGTAVIDYCQLYLDNTATPNWYHADDLHPGTAAIPALQTYTAQKVKALYTCPAFPDKERVIFFFLFTAVQSYGGMNMQTNGQTTQANVYNNRGQLKAGASYTNGLVTWATSSRGNAGNFDCALSNHHIQSGWAYTNGSSHTHTLTMGAAYANRTGTMYVTWNANSARTARYTIGGSSADISAPQTGVQIVSIPFTADASGVIVMTVSAIVDSFAGISGFMAEFD